MRLLFAIPICLIAASAWAQSDTQSGQRPQDHVPPARAAQAGSDATAAATTQKQGSAPPPQSVPIVLDSVVAIINGDVILQSDVEQERRFESLELLPAAENTDVHAAEHLITRTLILQQMKQEEQSAPNITGADLDKFMAELKHQLPGCLPARCATDAEWAAYLNRLDLTPNEVRDRWKQRLTILDFLNLRFRTGVRIPTAQAQTYYQQTLVPQFTAKHVTAPAFKSLEPRIKEILLQQQVSKQIDQWEAVLRQEGSVEILVPAYGQSNANGDEDDVLAGGGACARRQVRSSAAEFRVARAPMVVSSLAGGTCCSRSCWAWLYSSRSSWPGLAGMPPRHSSRTRYAPS